MKVTLKWSQSCSVVSDSLWPHGLCSPWNSPDRNSRVGSRSLLQGIFPTQGLNPGLLHCRQILPAEPQGKPYTPIHWWNKQFINTNLQLQLFLIDSSSEVISLLLIARFHHLILQEKHPPGLTGKEEYYLKTLELQLSKRWYREAFGIKAISRSR